MLLQSLKYTRLMQKQLWGESINDTMENCDSSVLSHDDNGQAVTFNTRERCLSSKKCTQPQMLLSTQDSPIFSKSHYPELLLVKENTSNLISYFC